MTISPRLSRRRHFAFISAGVIMGLSSMRMSTEERISLAANTSSQSLSSSWPVISFWESTKLWAESRRVTS